MIEKKKNCITIIKTNFLTLGHLLEIFILAS